MGAGGSGIPTISDDLSPAADHFNNRELSWLRFNERVLEEAECPRHPLLERVRFLSIFANNLDEFFMIRVSGLRQQIAGGVTEPSVDGLTPSEQQAAIRRALLPLLDRMQRCWLDDLTPALARTDIHVVPYASLKKKQRRHLKRYFEREVFPALTPLAFDPGHPFPHISNVSLNLAVLLDEPGHGERFARLKVPDLFPRLVRIVREESLEDEFDSLDIDTKGANTYVFLEELVAAHLDRLFPGLNVVSVGAFRVTRDAELEIEEDEAADLLSNIEETLRLRHFGSAVRLELAADAAERIRDILMRNLGLAPYQVYALRVPVGLADLAELARLPRPELKFPPFQPALPPGWTAEAGLFTQLRRGDLVLFHPYDSFAPVVDFVQRAARDPQVVTIKQTLYRVGQGSPIVESLMEARVRGKQVAALIELKARFDEEENISWARALEDAGVHVVYGLPGLKVHAKLCLVVRREADGLRQYLHLGTGNYNEITARGYTDLGLFTCDDDLCADAMQLFNALTGYSRKEDYRRLLVAPSGLREAIVARIEREIAVQQGGGEGYLAFKMNSLVDPACIQALYRASRAGVRVDLQVRGICCLRPGVPGLSEHITVTSLVGRFLEHARMFYFRNGGEGELLLGSADLMQRNLDRRVEVLFPVVQPSLRRDLVEKLVLPHFRDQAQARLLKAEGNYERRSAGGEGFSVQQALLGGWR